MTDNPYKSPEYTSSPTAAPQVRIRFKGAGFYIGLALLIAAVVYETSIPVLVGAAVLGAVLFIAEAARIGRAVEKAALAPTMGEQRPLSKRQVLSVLARLALGVALIGSGFGLFAWFFGYHMPKKRAERERRLGN